jgi:hypothetical protein
MQVIRGAIVASELQFSVPPEEFFRHNFGPTRLTVAHKLLAAIGIELEDVETMQHFERDGRMVIRCRG